MSYKYGGKQTVEAELRRLEEQKRRGRKELLERRALIQRLRRSRATVEQLEADNNHFEQEIRHLTANVQQLPPPKYGGPQGLRAAAQEAAAHDARKRAA